MPTPVHSPRLIFQEARDVPDFAKVDYQGKPQYLIGGVVRDWNGTSEEALWSPSRRSVRNAEARLGPGGRPPTMGES